MPWYSVETGPLVFLPAFNPLLMEYTFYNNPEGKLIRIILSDFSFSVSTESNEMHIPYASILSVRLKRSGKKYFTIVKSSYYPEIKISYLNHRADEASKYNSFVKDFHVHLSNKSMAYYECGNSLPDILLSCCLAVLLAFGVSYLIDNSESYQRNLLAIGLSIFSIASIALVNRKQFPNVYKPELIPTQFLPLEK